eukprot:TRINITY_DN51392_c0_g1_i1.p1 TRINITY_DN51392_c0_g1~~TRINITY_DN51392_c0_g1_i1.p1  ORF type:complete len:182 (-),score=13.82 TRINITY_DN51392_c0_g1_i1:159-704(-)
MPRGHFDTPGLFDQPTWLLGMVRYLAQQPGSRRQYGIAPHQDSGIFTLLYTDGGAGLEMCPDWTGSGVHRDYEMLDDQLSWQPVPHLEGHWVENFGTLLHRWTNGLCKPTLHRVVPHNPGTERYSLPFFYEPNIDAKIECLGSCVHLQEPLAPTCPGQIALDQMAVTRPPAFMAGVIDHDS